MCISCHGCCVRNYVSKRYSPSNQQSEDWPKISDNDNQCFLIFAPKHIGTSSAKSSSTKPFGTPRGTDEVQGWMLRQYSNAKSPGRRVLDSGKGAILHSLWWWHFAVTHPGHIALQRRIPYRDTRTCRRPSWHRSPRYCREGDRRGPDICPWLVTGSIQAWRGKQGQKGFLAESLSAVCKDVTIVTLR